MSVITHEHDSLYASACDQIIRQAAAVNMIDPDNCNVGLTPVIDVIEEIIGDGLYRFMQYCMAKCEKAMSLEGEPNRYLPRRDQVKLFRFLSLYGCQTLDLKVDLRGTKQVMVYTESSYRELVYFFANEHKHKTLTIKDLRIKLEGRILFHFLFVDSEYTRIVDEHEQIDWGFTGSFGTYGIAKLLPEYTKEFMHLKRDYSTIGSSSVIMITLFQQCEIVRNCFASPKCLGFEFPFFKDPKNSMKSFKKLFNEGRDEIKCPKISLSGFKKRGKSAYSFQVMLGTKEEQMQHKNILDWMNIRASNLICIDANFIESHTRLKEMKVSLSDIDPARLKITYLVDRPSSDTDGIHLRQTPSMIKDVKTGAVYRTDGIDRHGDSSKHDRRYTNDVLHLSVGRLSDSNPTLKLPKLKHDIVVVHHIRNDP